MSALRHTLFHPSTVGRLCWEARRLLALLAGALAVLALAASARSAPGDLVLVSSRADGTKGSGLAFQTSESPSADGSRVAFQSLSANLVPADPDTLSDIFVKDVLTGALTLASTGPTGVKADGDSFDASLSRDGTVVAFASTARNLSPRDPDALMDIYVKDLLSGAVTLASVNAAGVKGSDRSDNPSLSADGRTVAFESRAANLDVADPDATADIYVKDLATGTLRLTSTSSAGAKGNDFSTLPSLAPNGASVAFQSRASNLDPADPDALADIYVKDLAGGALELASVTAAGTKGAADSFSPSLSGDGNRVAFHTTSTNLDPADTDVDVADVYVKDRSSGALLLASITPAGVKAAGAPFLGSADASLSADGTRVAFETAAANLLAADPDTAYDIYVKDLATADLELASTTAQGVKSNADNAVSALARDAGAVAFVSAATNLAPADTDPVPDVYLKARTSAPCTDLSGLRLGQGPNPRRPAGHVIRVTTPSFPTTEIRVDRDLRGLNLRARTVIHLALPSRAAAVTLAHFAKPVTVRAFNADGTLAATKTMTAPQATLERLVLRGRELTRLVLRAPAQEATLSRLCHRPVCTITGTDGPDVLTGTDGPDVICARGGRDVVRGRDGADRLYTGSGDDVARGGRGRDHAFAGNGGDRVRGGAGRDRLRGGRGNDRLDGGPAADRCAGGPGSDFAKACEILTGVP